MHTTLYFLFMLLLLLFSQLFLPSLEFPLSIIPQLPLVVGKSASEPPSHLALDVESGLVSLLHPQVWWEEWLWVYDLVIPSVNVDVSLLHLGSKLSHHNGGLCIVLVGLDDAFVSLWMIGSRLICLREGVMIGLTCLVAPETPDIGLHSALLLDLNCDYLDLVVSQSDLNLKHVWHHELISLNWVIIIAACLLCTRHLSWDVHLLMMLLLLPIEFQFSHRNALHLHVLLLLLLLLEVHLLLMLLLESFHLSLNCHALFAFRTSIVASHIVAHLLFFYNSTSFKTD